MCWELTVISLSAYFVQRYKRLDFDAAESHFTLDGMHQYKTAGIRQFAVNGFIEVIQEIL